MASYKDIQGFNIQNLTSDPVPFAQEKINNPWAGTWSSGGNMNTGRSTFGATGTQTAALAATGQTGPGNVGTTNVELYDGSAWTETTNVNTARRGAAASGASNTDSLIFGGIGPIPSGSPPPSLITGVTEDWNGSAWTEVSDLNTARFYIGPAARGTSTATLAFGGYTTTSVNNVESWNGSSWTETTEINTARSYIYGLGVQTSAIAAAGYTTDTVTNVELWNGSSWTEIAEVNQAKLYGGSSGTSTDGIIFGGQLPGATAQTESWNGSVWTEVNDLASANETIRGNGASGSVAWASGGDSYVVTTQEWAFTGIPPTAPAAGYSDAIIGQIYYNSTTGSFKAITDGGAPVGTWSSGGSLNSGRGSDGASGGLSVNDIIIAGGNPGAGYVANTETYNGTSWTEVNDLNTARGEFKGAVASTTSSFLVFGGAIPPVTGVTESWNGTNWTEVNDLNTARETIGGAGTQTAALGFGGEAPAATGATESWNGTSWTEVNDLNTARARPIGIGVQTAALAVGGIPTASSESWNGTSWTSITNLNSARYGGAGAGIQTSGLYSGGDLPPNTAQTEFWNGSSWTEVADLATARRSQFGSGVSSSAVVAGGYVTGFVSNTEEFTYTDFVINTLT